MIPSRIVDEIHILSLIPLLFSGPAQRGPHLKLCPLRSLFSTRTSREAKIENVTACSSVHKDILVLQEGKFKKVGVGDNGAICPNLYILKLKFQLFLLINYPVDTHMVIGKSTQKAI